MVKCIEYFIYLFILFISQYLKFKENIRRYFIQMENWNVTYPRLLYYTGPLIMKNVLPDKCYSNFQSFSIAMIIHLSPDKKILVKFAKDLLVNILLRVFNLCMENNLCLIIFM